MSVKVTVVLLAVSVVGALGGVAHPAPVVASPAVATPLLAAPAAKALVAAPVGVQSYTFGYNTADEYGTRQTRQETSDVNNVRSGSYGYAEANGVFRHVNYIADAAGFRATVSTNEPGTAAGPTAGALYNAAPLPAAPVLKAAAAPVLTAPYKAALAPAPLAVPAYHQPVQYAHPAAPVVAAPRAAPVVSAYGPRYL